MGVAPRGAAQLRCDRRARIPELTPTGDQLRTAVAAASAAAENQALSGFGADDVNVFRRLLVDLIGDSADPGSCL